MFNPDFFPTNKETFDAMTFGIDFTGKTVWEPEAGKGDMIEMLQARGAKVICCENDPDLVKIASSKAKLIARDCLTVTSDMVSHIDFIVMNPPFSAAPEHILHCFGVAPAGCRVIALCNYSNLENAYTKARKELKTLVSLHGEAMDLGDCFATAERKTSVRVAMITMQKPGDNYDAEFEGFFMDEEPEEAQENGIMPYNAVRDIVNRYVAAVKLFDKQLEVGVQMEALIGEIRPSYYDGKDKDNGLLEFTATQNGVKVMRADFKKSLQKRSWLYIFQKMNMQKYATKGLKEDINKFVEQQSNIPFTMRNIFKMLEIVVGTQSQRMDKAIEEVFDKLTQHTHENRYGVEAWKSNSHFCLTKQFVMPWMVDFDSRWPNKNVRVRYGGNRDIIDDMVKAICYITATNYDDCTDIGRFCSDIEMDYGTWYSWGFFEIKGHKKGTMHFRFQNEDLWAKFNQHIARIKGYPLFDAKEQTAYQNRQTGRKKQAA